VLSGRGLCDGLITRPEESYRHWRVVCDQETSRMRRLKPATGLWKIQPKNCNAKKTNRLFSRVELLQKPSDVCNCDIKSFEQLGVNIVTDILFV